jgi:outer membrane lipopolysaccharide assembly protein LptE/RlpB
MKTRACGWLRSVPIVALILSLCGCGYQFQGGGVVLPPDVTKIYIPLAQNNSSEAGLAAVVTEALREQFERYGALTVVDEIGDADAVLTARILRVKQGSRTSTSRTDSVQQYDITVSIAGELRRVTGQVLWSNAGMTITGSSAATSGAVVTSSAPFAGSGLSSADLAGLNANEVSRGSRQAVLENLADQAARRIYNDAVAPDF